ncbi:tRNA pseudouridine(55) synthase TruB [Candidatus Sumerlaeota bacterium]|nr:tRNA pseudouridine(55) synthase TruB [Candidatus Sumerlaeales bacterium]NLD60871.1 tRNA pseudouridine(55) synthase TruB [Candidatus Sumerlaeota bacterium]
MKHNSNPAYAGLLPVFKPAGPTSHDVVDITRRALRQREVGHTGTLDPVAEGLLILCLGPYTKLSPFMMEHDKAYEGTFLFGITTDTDDTEGIVINMPAVDTMNPPSDKAIADAVKKQTGNIEQVPPQYSAIKIDGKKLYEYAREGKSVAVCARNVCVYKLELGAPEAATPSDKLVERTGIANPTFAERLRNGAPLWRVSFRAEVSTGTYIRSLARDIGEMLGIGGCMESLTRTKVAHITAAQAMPVQLLRDEPDKVRDYILRGEQCIDPNLYPIVKLRLEFERIMLNGQPVHNLQMVNAEDAAKVGHEKICAIVSESGRLLAMAKCVRTDKIKIKQAYDVPFATAFRAERIFPNGLN